MIELGLDYNKRLDVFYFEHWADSSLYSCDSLLNKERYGCWFAIDLRYGKELTSLVKDKSDGFFP